MRMIPIESSMICAAGYDQKTKEMKVVYANGNVYTYGKVKKEDFEGLLRAGSKGRFMNENIIDVYHEYNVS